MGVFSRVWTATSCFFRVQQTVLFVNRAPPTPPASVVISPSPSPPPKVEVITDPSGPGILSVLISISGMTVATLSLCASQLELDDLSKCDVEEDNVDLRTTALEGEIKVLEGELSKATSEANDIEAKLWPSLKGSVEKQSTGV